MQPHRNIDHAGVLERVIIAPAKIVVPSPRLKKSASIYRKHLLAGILLLAFAFSFTPTLIPLIPHDHAEHSDEHPDHHHSAEKCDISHPCHLAIFHAGEHRLNQCSHHAHYTESHLVCKVCQLFVQTSTADLPTQDDTRKPQLALRPPGVTYAQVTSPNEIQELFLRGPPSF